MSDWNLFAGVAVVLLIALLALARATARVLTSTGEVRDDLDRLDGEPGGGPASPDSSADRPLRTPTSDGALLANAALSHGLLGAFLVAAAWYAGIPWSAFGVAVDGGAVALGAGLGVALSVANEAGARLAERLGYNADERLREFLAPDSLGGWLLLLAVVLPTIAVVEELLFRGALIGALAAGYGLSPWWLAVVSSIAFGLGHGLQGPGGVVVTGVLGFVLAAAFVVTGSLLVVVIAHYLVNALEFVVHEGLGVGSR